MSFVENAVSKLGPYQQGAINGSTTMTVIRMVDPRPAVALSAAQISLA
ncbi:MAG: hypothetical protein QOJ96_1291 [Alphaproteobacteria bacterium]|jgi:hypothetical protein|nr:hypothetical protein [Alphaproteobacteria bacterium]